MMRAAIAALVFTAACADAGAPALALTGHVDKTASSCPTVAAGIAPDGPSPYLCPVADSLDSAVMADVDNFWGSQVALCGCASDFPGGCDGAFSLAERGYIYAGGDFMHKLDGSKSVMQYLYAHELGHEIEGHFGVFAANLQQHELTADCLAGYYLGSVVCRGDGSEVDIRTAVATACITADGSGDRLADITTHGTCEQRATAVEAGMSAYLAGTAALAACTP